MNELTLLLNSQSGGEYRCQVLESPLDDRPSNLFPRPLDEEDLKTFREYCTLIVEAACKGTEPPAPPPGLSHQQVGERLAAALFGGEVGAHFSRCQGLEGPLRIRLVFDPADGESEYLGSLPWELVRDVEHREVWGRKAGTPLVRDFSTLSSSEAWSGPRPLNILVVQGVADDLDFDGERLGIGEALADLERAGEVEIYTARTLHEMRARLKDLDIHILHYQGHCGYLEEEGLGAVYVDHGRKETKQVDGDFFAEHLTDVGSLRQVVLNTCQSARYSGAEERPFFSSVVAGLLRSGSSVVAMQQAISDPVAIKFSSALYERLAQEEPVDAAVTETRLALSHGSLEWSTPVLFLCSDDGRLFDFEQGAARRSGKEGEPIALKPPVKRLEIRSFPEREARPTWGGPERQRFDEVIDLRDCFDDRFIRNDNLWLDEVLPRLSRQLKIHTLSGRPLCLNLVAHHSVAFAAGWWLESKSGQEVSLIQQTRDGRTAVWSADDDSRVTGEAPLWEERDDILLPGGGTDIALAVGVTKEIAEEVRVYVEKKGLPVGRIVDAVPRGGAGQTSVRGGAHALQLADELEARVGKRSPHERAGQLHIFQAVPAALTFFLGRASLQWGGLTLYEHAHGTSKPYAAYHPSLTLPPPGSAEPPAHWGA